MKPASVPRATLRDLQALEFDNSFVRELPADRVQDNVPRQVPGASYTRVDPTPVASPRLLGWSAELGEYLGIAKPASAEVLGGNRVLPGMQPYAARYGGHQNVVDTRRSFPDPSSTSSSEISVPPGRSMFAVANIVPSLSCSVIATPVPASASPSGMASSLRNDITDGDPTAPRTTAANSKPDG